MRRIRGILVREGAVLGVAVRERVDVLRAVRRSRRVPAGRRRRCAAHGFAAFRGRTLTLDQYRRRRGARALGGEQLEGRAR